MTHIIPGLQSCPDYDKAVAAFKQRQLDQQCAQAGKQFDALVANHQLPQAREIIRQARAAGCRVNDAAAAQALEKAENEIAAENERRRQEQIAAQQAEIRRQQEEARRREQEQERLLNTMQGIVELIQDQQGGSSSSSSSGGGSSSSSGGSEPTCEDVCVQEQVVWLNKTDGRHSLCANGVARRPGPGMPLPKCEKNVRCVKKERRCR